MSENSSDIRIIKGKPRAKKLKPRIDLTAMVSVSFLLIVFFMVTVELSKPQMMDLGMPEGGCGEFTGSTCGGWSFDRTITLLLDDDNKVISYCGLLEVTNEPPKKLAYGKNGIRKELIAKNKIITEYLAKRNYNSNNRSRGTIVIIKPSKKSNYGNLVDILDEMAITKIGTYVIINDFTPDEYKLLASN